MVARKLADKVKSAKMSIDSVGNSFTASPDKRLGALEELRQYIAVWLTTIQEKDTQK